MVKRTSVAKKPGATKGKAKKPSTAMKEKARKPSAGKAARKTAKRVVTTVPKAKKSSAAPKARTRSRAQPKKSATDKAKKLLKPSTPRGITRAALRAAPQPTLWPVHVVTVDEVYAGDPANNPGSAEFAYRILAEGDSWFTIGGIPTSNLLFELRLPQQGIVCNIAYPGDTLVHIADLASNNDLKKMLTDRFGYRWHAILLSAGGNDLMDRAGEILRNPGTDSTDPQDYIAPEAFANFIDAIKLGYRTIVGLRDSSQSANHGVPVIAHCYDYPTPRNSPARFFGVGFLGPWLYKAFNDKGISESARVAVSDYLVDALAGAIESLAAEPDMRNFYFVDTRKLLQRAEQDSTTVSGDWLNEIHPNSDGYRKLAEKIGAMLLSVLPG